MPDETPTETVPEETALPLAETIQQAVNFVPPPIGLPTPEAAPAEGTVILGGDMLSLAEIDVYYCSDPSKPILMNIGQAIKDKRIKDAAEKAADPDSGMTREGIRMRDAQIAEDAAKLAKSAS